jgi:hypothetical protein
MRSLVNFINKLITLGFKVQAKNLSIIVQNLYDINQIINELTSNINNNNKLEIPKIDIVDSDLIQKSPKHPIPIPQRLSDDVGDNSVMSDVPYPARLPDGNISKCYIPDIFLSGVENRKRNFQEVVVS